MNRPPAWMLLRRWKRQLSESVGLRHCTYRGRPFYYPASSYIGRQVKNGTGWDTVLARILLLVNEVEPVVIEVGSNIGASLMQMKIAKPQARVVCFEPSQRFLPALRKNIAANGWRDVTVETMLVSGRGGRLTLHNNTTTASVVSREYDDHVYLSSEEHVAVALDTYCASLSHLDFLKVDTDGHEYEVFSGAQATLRRLRPLLFFELADYMLQRAGQTAEGLLLLLRSLGYHDLLALDQVGHCIGMGHTPADVVTLAAGHQYIDVVAAHHKRAEQVGQLSLIAAEAA